MRNLNPNPENFPFVLNDGDSFFQIIASETIPYAVSPECESIITFFVVARADQTFEIIQIMKTFKGTECISRVVQKKPGISAARINKEIADIEGIFSKAIEAATGYKIKWQRLDLSGIEGRHDQVAAIAAWGRVGVTVELGGGISLN
jgi:hypothetical protein